MNALPGHIFRGRRLPYQGGRQFLLLLRSIFAITTLMVVFDLKVTPKRTNSHFVHSGGRYSEGLQLNSMVLAERYEVLHSRRIVGLG